MSLAGSVTPRLSQSGHDITPLPPAEVERLAKKLTSEERHILLDHGTERPFCGALLDNKEKGVYACRLCSLPLFKVGHEVRVRHRLAELLPAVRS